MMSYQIIAITSGGEVLSDPYHNFDSSEECKEFVESGEFDKDGVEKVIIVPVELEIYF